jgi:hypothetical protein
VFSKISNSKSKAATPPPAPPAKPAANRHREWLHRPEQADLRAAVRRELRGLRLGCWCEQPGPCHGHNLCEVADADFDAGGDGSAL